MPFLILLWFCFWWAPANAETNKLDNIAACAGIVIGNGAIDFFMGDEAAFDGAADIAYSAYLSEVFTGQAAQNDIQIADQILATNTDKIINAANTETFDANVYEEVVTCYRRVASLLLKNRKTIEKNSKKIELLIEQRIKLLKRFLSAG